MKTFLRIVIASVFLIAVLYIASSVSCIPNRIDIAKMSLGAV